MNLRQTITIIEGIKALAKAKILNIVISWQEISGLIFDYLTGTSDSNAVSPLQKAQKCKNSDIL